jgi:protein-tyrosine phosphatase
MAEVLLRHHLGDVGAEVGVSSAGLYPGGRPATQHGRDAMADRGLDLSGHQSRQLDRSMLDGADLVIGMAREHVREVAVLDPEALPRTFALKELVRGATAVGPRHADETMTAWLGRVGAGRQRDALLGVGHDGAYDIEDPVGRSRADYDATAQELDQLLMRLVGMAWPTTAAREQERSA